MPIIYNYTGSINDNLNYTNVNNYGLGLLYPFGVSSKPIDYSFTTLDRVKSNLLLLLHTEKGERVMNPEYGVVLRRYLFEPNIIDMLPMIKEQLHSDINRWIPELNITELNLNIDNNNIMISIKGMVINEENRIELNINL